RARPDPVRHYFRRARRRPPHADAARTAKGILNMTPYAKRKRVNAVVMALCYAATAFGLGFLLLILGTLFWRGFSGLNLAVFTEMTPPPGSRGGLLNAILGSLIMTILGVVIGAPLGMLAGTYMAEYGRYSRLTIV